MADSIQRRPQGPRSQTLADILERVLETGIVIAGDIRVNLNDVELLTVQIRLVVCSVDKAEEMGMDWWKSASYLQAGAEPDAVEAGGATQEQFEELNQRLARLEKSVGQLAEATGAESGAAEENADDQDD
jgi:hypothetical protein